VKASTSDLAVVQVGPTIACSLDELKKALISELPDVNVITPPPLPNPSDAYDSSRDQYHSTRILVFLEKQLQNIPANRMLGVAAFDLFVPGMNFVFGEARCPGRVAVISTLRLKTKVGKSRLFKERVLKEATHEVGHMLGLRHCDEALCVMHFSERIEDTDAKKSTFCEDCLTSLERRKVEQEIQS